jgi:hypothetical protein
MPRLFGRLPFLSRPNAADREPTGASGLAGATIDPDAAPIGPPVLLPATIFRQVLLDSTEITPAWLRSRPGPNREPARPEASAADDRVNEAAAAADKPPTSKTTRRSKAAAKPAEPKPAARRKARRTSSGRPQADS